MKFFLGCDQTTDKKSTRTEGTELVYATAPADLVATWERQNAELTAIMKKGRLPLPLRILQLVCMFCALCCISGILRADVTIEEAYANAPVFFYIAGVTAVIAIVLSLISKKLFSSVQSSEELDRLVHEMERTANEMDAAMGVPEETECVDIFRFPYTVKDGLAVLKKKERYANGPADVYVQDGKLCISDETVMYAIYLEDISCIRTVKKNIGLMTWNKEVPHTDSSYASYKISRYKNQYSVPSYCILEFTSNGQKYGLAFPNYELPTFTRLTGLRPIE